MSASSDPRWHGPSVQTIVLERLRYIVAAELDTRFAGPTQVMLDDLGHRLVVKLTQDIAAERLKVETVRYPATWVDLTHILAQLSGHIGRFYSYRPYRPGQVLVIAETPAQYEDWCATHPDADGYLVRQLDDLPPNAQLDSIIILGFPQTDAGRLLAERLVQ